MPVLSLNASEEDDTTRSIEEPRKPINANGMFGRYEHDSHESFSFRSSTNSLKPETNRGEVNQLASSSSNVKTWTQPLVTSPKNLSTVQPSAPLSDEKVKSSEQATPIVNVPVAPGQQITASRAPNVATSSPSVAELLNVDTIGQSSVDDGPKAADLVNSRQETLVCQNQLFLCTRPVVSGELYCWVHLPVHSKRAIRCNYINSESEDECDEQSVNHGRSMNGLCPMHSTLADAKRSAYNKGLQGKRTIASYFSVDSPKDTRQRLDHGITQNMTFPLRPCAWPTESSLQLSDQPSEHVRFDPQMYGGCLTSVQLIAILRDKYDELLECLAMHCTALHHIIKLKKKLAVNSKITPEGYDPEDPEIAESVGLFKRFMKPRHESAFIYEMKKRKRARKAFDSDPKTKCAYAEEESSCDQTALPSSQFCIDHVLCDEKQALFLKCEESECKKPRKLWDKFCADHATMSVAERISQVRSASMKRPTPESEEDDESDDPNRRRSVRLKKRLRKHVKLNRDGTYVYEYSPKSMSEMERDAGPASCATHGSNRNRDSAQSTSEAASEPSRGNSDPSMTAELALLDHQYGGAPFSCTNVKKDLRTEVPDELVPWQKPFSSYHPPYWTVPCSFRYCDPEVNISTMGIRFNQKDRGIDRRMVRRLNGVKAYYEVSDGLPLNPLGRTGIAGRGYLPRWGPTHLVKVVLLRKRRGHLKIEYLAANDKLTFPEDVFSNFVDKLSSKKLSERVIQAVKNSSKYRYRSDVAEKVLSKAEENAIKVYCLVAIEYKV
ncbi:zf-C3Hc3H domain containing protein [Trichuris trichiura]|uniref:Zf-C3Hc3H domain containing protein n=1 Tax=Trichuris trichiura TaxID=36087 RepID=A0A077ZHQ3_TRITR|nr:zf-C3Hc3H domain containing protein [Trichuris trichiura]